MRARSSLEKALPILDAVVALFCLPASFLFLFVRRFGVEKLRLTRKVFMNVGVFPIRDHYYEPLFNPRHLGKPLDDDRILPGINLNDAGQQKLLGELSFSDELVGMKLDQPPKSTDDFYVGNSTFGPGDAEFLYQFIRHTKPRKVVEIGSGHSTKIARLALEQNRSTFGIVAEHSCIEPYEMPWLEGIGVKVMRKKVEDCPIGLFDDLDAGDFLFIDSSHMIRPQGDVLREYLEILPRLKSGVNIHVHDIFTPKDYLTPWIREKVLFWNEQYLLEAMLSSSNRYSVVAALNYLKHHHYDLLQQVCPYLSRHHEPGSFYLRTT
jgi:uncharacterized UPF0146 family protein